MERNPGDSLTQSRGREGKDRKKGAEADQAVNTSLNEMEVLKQNINSYMK